MLSNIGTVIGLENGPLTDQFFLQFDQLGTQKDVIVEATPRAGDACPGAAAGRCRCAQLRAGEFDLLAAHGRADHEHRRWSPLIRACSSSCPPINTLEAYSSANQVGVAQLAVQYCSQVMASPGAADRDVPRRELQQSERCCPGAPHRSRDRCRNSRSAAGGLASQPAASTVSTELNNLIGILCSGSAPCNSTARVSAVTVAACAAALGNADVLID